MLLAQPLDANNNQIIVFFPLCQSCEIMTKAFQLYIID
jgi:hypothetical protein